MTNPTTDAFDEWLRLAEEAFNGPQHDTRADGAFNAWSQPVAWLAQSR